MKKYFYRQFYIFHNWLDTKGSKFRLLFGIITTLGFILPINLIDNVWESGIPLVGSILLILLVLISIAFLLTRILYSHGEFTKYKPNYSEEIMDIWKNAEKLFKKDNYKSSLVLYKKFLRLNKGKYYHENLANERMKSIEKNLFREKRLKKLLK